jgi:hypothetical protein
VRVLE